MKEISLSGKEGGIAIVDDEIYDLLNQWKWRKNSCGYASRMGDRKHKGGKVIRTIQFMHRLIMGNPLGAQIDHINGQKLDNRRSNLRFADQHINNGNRMISRTNTSGFKGVHLDRASGKWQAQIKHGHKCKYLGKYANKEDAARAYDKAAIEYFGPLTWTNFGEHRK